MKKLIKKRSDGIKETIKYNQWGQALGKEGNHLVSMVRSLARKYVPINIDHWTQVPEEKKNLMCETVLARLSVILVLFVKYLYHL